MEQPIKAAWEKIGKIASPKFKSELKLMSGSTDAEIKAFEKKIGIDLPEEVRECYRVTNGGFVVEIRGQSIPYDFGLGGLAFSPLSEVFDAWETWSEQSKEFQFLDGNGEPYKPQSQAIRAQYFHKGWIPIFRYSDIGHFCIDIAPTESGTVGQVIEWDLHDGPVQVLADNLRGFLNKIANGIDGDNQTWYTN